ncbi:hypothetical protein ACET3Z_024530 [Daucus carota]
MLSSARIFACTPAPSVNNLSPSSRLFASSTTCRKSYDHRLVCKAASNSSSSISDFDLYDLLGVDSSSDQADIKLAYRTLQKRCHPDIAGAAGHDMAIVLNEAYALLSDPNTRFLYDKEQAKFEGFRGYTGKPLYSSWFGSESEERAVFVDEVKCVGCLKCALLAEKTFAIESVHGRARVVGQWADPEDKIQEAIGACPVDCISVIERSNLAALEFLMSKQPRGNVRVGAGNTAGVRVSNIFVDVEKFQQKFKENKDRTTVKHSKDSDLQKESRISAIQTIRAISNWLYWQAPISRGSPSSNSGQHMRLLPDKSSEHISSDPSLDKIREVAASRKQARETPRLAQKVASESIVHDDYWVPLSDVQVPKSTAEKRASEFTPSWKSEVRNKRRNVALRKKQNNPFVDYVPLVLSMAAAVIVRAQIGEGSAGGLQDHIYGSFALEFVNSSWLPVILTGITWYLIGLYVAKVVEAVQSKIGNNK